MRLPFFRTTLFSCSFLLLNALPSPAQQKSEPQLVRITYTQGEVKLSPGKDGKPSLDDYWMQAETGLTVEQGYTLATENGRAVVEFENGSVVYLAEHSVLQFQKLQINDAASTTKLNLLTGTATIAHVSRGEDELTISTPTNKLQSKKDMTVRMDSLLNGTVVRAVDVPVTIKKMKSPLNPGEAVAYFEGFPFRFKAEPAQQQDNWDQWVAAQRLEREAYLTKGLQESGLTEPVPGLADLAKNGRFFDCPPYGRCWEPNQEADKQVNPAQPMAQQTSQIHAPAKRNVPQRGPFVINRTLLTRCPMETWVYTVNRPDASGQLEPDDQFAPYTLQSFPWMGCFAGSWYYRGRRPVYVIGHRHHHHHHPYWTVHTAHGLAIVPRSPLDRKGQPPANAKNGIFVLKQQVDGLQGKFEHNSLSANQHWQTSVPKSFTQEPNFTAGVAKVAAPVIQGHMVNLGSAGIAKSIQAAARPENAIHFDYMSKNFVAPRASMFPGSSGHSGGGPVVVAHVGSHSVSGGGTAHSGGSGGEGHAGSGSSGGGGHASGGGGGGHAGGGSSGGGGTAGGGGSHH